jgi:hypothetical protein
MHAMPAPRRLTIDLELDGDSLRGTVSGGHQAAARFQNWLELLSAVEERRPETAEHRLTETSSRRDSARGKGTA